MNTFIRPALMLTLLFTLLCGVFYPLASTGLAQTLFPHQAHGSLTEGEGNVLGSELIAQGFTQARYFRPRPSAAGAGYDAAASSGSNYGPTSNALMSAIRERSAEAAKENPGTKQPIDLVTASASGLDPHISPAAAQFQLPRVAKARGLSEAAVGKLLSAHTEGRTLGLLGEPRVNVLKLNLALDALPAIAGAP